MGTVGVKSYFWPMQTQKSGLKQRNSFFLQDKKSGRWQSKTLLKLHDGTWVSGVICIPTPSFLLGDIHPSCSQDSFCTSRHCICALCRENGKGANSEELQFHTLSFWVLYFIFPSSTSSWHSWIISQNCYVATLVAKKYGNVIYIKYIYIKQIYIYIYLAGGHSEKIVILVERKEDTAMSAAAMKM